MSWESQNLKISPLPAAPSTVAWLISGIVALMACLLMFILHASTLVAALQLYNIWFVTAAPLFIWLLFLSLRGWVYGRASDRHHFEAGEANYAQQKWTKWAGRNIAVLHSGMMLPEKLTLKCFLAAPPELEQNVGLAKRIPLPEGDPFHRLTPVA